MKRTLSILFSIAIAITAIAGSPKLASEKIFDEIDVYDPSLSVTIVEKKDKTIKSVRFKNNQNLLKKIRKAVASDKEKADGKTLSSTNGEISEYFDIMKDKRKVKIGFNQSKSNEIYFFITIYPKTQQTRDRKVNRSSNRKTKNSKKTSKTNWTLEVMTDSDVESTETVISA